MDKCLDSQLWHACAGSMLQMPPVNSKVFYFPQGHAEHSNGKVDFANFPNVPALVLCRVSSIKYMADPETDEVFAKIRLIPLRNDGFEIEMDGFGGSESVEGQDKPASFAKTLTQSDANNGGGFSVPRYCAETIFPRLDYTVDPPVQTILAKDVHGEIWKFRHIYRGTPRRHLLTTGWSNFVNQKKLVAGDSIVFLRAENGDLCIGIRRAKRGIGSGNESSCGWNPAGGNCDSPYGGYSSFIREEENQKLQMSLYGDPKGKGKVTIESVIAAATNAANGQPFEVVYYPRASTPEFCVKATSVGAAMRIQWCSGMRFKMPFETEDSSRISWFMGTISSVQVADPVRWPNSPWRLLVVAWDEPDLLQNVKRVSPWLVELVSNMPSIHLAPFSPPRKKLRVSQQAELPSLDQIPIPTFCGNSFRPNSPFCYMADNVPAGIQGARHAQFGIPSSDLHLNKLQSSLFPLSFQQLNYAAPPSKISGRNFTGSCGESDNVSCLLTIGTLPKIPKKSNEKSPMFVLFGKPILTQEQISQSSSGDTMDNSSSDGNLDKTGNNNCDSHGDNSPDDGSPCFKDSIKSKLGLETGQCKVFMESNDAGRTLDLTGVTSCEMLNGKLSDMFSIRRMDEPLR